MAVALIDGGVGGEEVEVLAAVDVPDPGAGRALDDYVEGVVVMGAVSVLEAISSAARVDSCWNAEREAGTECFSLSGSGCVPMSPISGWAFIYGFARRLDVGDTVYAWSSGTMLY